MLPLDFWLRKKLIYVILKLKKMFIKIFAIGYICSPDRESEKLPPGENGYAAIPSPLFSTWDFGHALT